MAAPYVTMADTSMNARIVAEKEYASTIEERHCARSVAVAHCAIITCLGIDARSVLEEKRKKIPRITVLSQACVCTTGLLLIVKNAIPTTIYLCYKMCRQDG